MLYLGDERSRKYDAIIDEMERTGECCEYDEAMVESEAAMLFMEEALNSSISDEIDYNQY